MNSGENISHGGDEADRPGTDLLVGLSTNPIASLDRLLTSGVEVLRYEEISPADKIVDWVASFESNPEAITTLDKALVQWVEHRWSQVSVEWSDAWKWVCMLVTQLAELRLTRESLFAPARRIEAPTKLLPLTIARSSDPLGAYFDALASEGNLELAEFWIDLCTIPQGYHYFHGARGVRGLVRLKVENNDHQEFQSLFVAEGLLNLAKALLRLATIEGCVSLEIAKREWSKTATNVLQTKFTAEAWQSKLNIQFRDPTREEDRFPLECKKWSALVLNTSFVFNSFIPQQKEFINEGSNLGAEADASAKKLFLDNGWTSGNLIPVTALFDRLRYESRQKGTFDWLVKSLCSHSRAALKQGDATRCFDWAQEANRLAPWNPHTWEKLVDSLLLKEDLEGALNQAWAAYDRFPLEPRVQLALLEALTFAKRDEANYLKRRLEIAFADDFHRAFATKYSWLKKIRVSEKPIRLTSNLIFGSTVLGEFRFLLGMLAAGKGGNLVSRIDYLGNILAPHEVDNDQVFALCQHRKLLSSNSDIELAQRILKHRLELRPASLSLWMHYGTLLHKRATGLHWQEAQELLKAAPWYGHPPSSRIYPMVPLMEGFTALVATDGKPRADFAIENLEQVLHNYVSRNSLLDEPTDSHRIDLAGWAAGSLKEILGVRMTERLDGVNAVGLFDRLNQQNQQPIILRMPQLIAELGSSMLPTAK